MAWFVLNGCVSVQICLWIVFQFVSFLAAVVARVGKSRRILRFHFGERIIAGVSSGNG